MGEETKKSSRSTLLVWICLNLLWPIGLGFIMGFSLISISWTENEYIDQVYWGFNYDGVGLKYIDPAFYVEMPYEEMETRVPSDRFVMPEKPYEEGRTPDEEKVLAVGLYEHLKLWVMDKDFANLTELNVYEETHGDHHDNMVYLLYVIGDSILFTVIFMTAGVILIVLGWVIMDLES